MGDECLRREWRCRAHNKRLSLRLPRLGLDWKLRERVVWSRGRSWRAVDGLQDINGPRHSVPRVGLYAADDEQREVQDSGEKGIHQTKSR